MSLFFEYFKNLNWLYLKENSAITAIIHGLSLVLDETKEKITWVRNQGIMGLCDDEYINDHARSRNIQTRINETPEQFKRRVFYAFIWFRKSGRKSGMQESFNVAGFPDIGIINCRDEDPERWAEFKLIFDDENKFLTHDQIKTITEIANIQKPARSKLASIDLSDLMQQNSYFAGCHISIIEDSIPAYIPEQEEPPVYKNNFLNDPAGDFSFTNSDILTGFTANIIEGSGFSTPIITTDSYYGENYLKSNEKSGIVLEERIYNQTVIEINYMYTSFGASVYLASKGWIEDDMTGINLYTEFGSGLGFQMSSLEPDSSIYKSIADSPPDAYLQKDIYARTSLSGNVISIFVEIPEWGIFHSETTILDIVDSYSTSVIFTDNVYIKDIKISKNQLKLN